MTRPPRPGCDEPSSSPRPGRGPTPTRGSAASSSRPTAPGRRRGPPPRGRHAARRDRGPARRRRRGPGGDRLRDASSRARTPAAPVPARTPSSRRASRGSSSRSRTRTRTPREAPSVLHAAGIHVTGGVLADEAAALNDRWARSVALGRPLVTWKLATTLDGSSAAADGSSQWITGEAARADVHALRATRDAVLVGTGTVLADDPRLTVRMPGGGLAPQQPLRVVMGSVRRPAGARLHDAPGEVLHLRTRDPSEALNRLWHSGIRDVWLEGGPTLAAAFLRAGLVDDVYAYVAPALLGSGRAAVADLGITSIADVRRLDLVDVDGRRGRRPHPRRRPPASARRTLRRQSCSPESSRSSAPSPPSSTAPTRPCCASTAPSSSATPSTAPRSPSTASASP